MEDGKDLTPTSLSEKNIEDKYFWETISIKATRTRPGRTTISIARTGGKN